MSEGFFYGLDTLPLLVAVWVYVPFWPGEFVDERMDRVKRDAETGEAEGVGVEEKNVKR